MMGAGWGNREARLLCQREGHEAEERRPPCLPSGEDDVRHQRGKLESPACGWSSSACVRGHNVPASASASFRHGALKALATVARNAPERRFPGTRGGPAETAPPQARSPEDTSDREGAGASRPFPATAAKAPQASTQDTPLREEAVARFKGNC